MFDMRRREFITLLGSAAAAWPLAARAQQPERLRRVGVLTAMSETDPTLPPRMAAFQKGLQAFGWAEGRNVSIVYRHATSDLDRLKSAALELVAAAPELIVVWSNPAVMAMRAVDRSIPVVFVSVGDPVGSGFVESLGRPGGNLTGFTAFEPEMGGKWLEHLKEVAPALTRAMVLLHPDIAANFEFYRAAQAAGTALRINVDAVHVRGAADIQRAVSALAGEPHAGVLVLPNPVSASHRELIASLSAAHRVPSVAGFRSYVESGVLIGYGPEMNDLWRRSASYVDRILRGDPPASLPVQTPVKFELAINLKTAKALGLEIPPTLLARADEVIE
jgi:putative tryptophan/tyrosine transport system substrate-binding protein